MTNQKLPRWRRRLRQQGLEDVPSMSDEEIERRIDALGGRPQREPIEREHSPSMPNWPGLLIADAEPGIARIAAPTEVVHASAVRVPSVDPRRVLWRDSAVILAVALIALLAAQAFAPGGSSGPAVTPVPGGIVIGSLPPEVSLAPGQTLGPIIDPGLGIDATPTPIPVITLGPSQSPTPSPSPSPKPTQTPAPSPTPAPTPTAAPTQTPAPTPTAAPSPTPTAPPPPPNAVFSCLELAGLELACTDSSNGSISNWTWNWGDGSQDTGANPPTHMYSSDISPVDVRLTVTGPGGTDFVVHTYTLIP